MSLKAKKELTKITRIYIGIDQSGSMMGWHKKAKEALNALIRDFKKDFAKQEVYLTVVSFSNTIESTFCKETNLTDVKEFEENNDALNGATALNETLSTLTSMAEKHRLALKNVNDAYLIYVITDGQATDTHLKSSAVRDMKTAIATDKYSYAFSGPPGSIAYISDKYRVPCGNITEWERSATGFKELATKGTTLSSSYSVTRALGQTNNRSLFSPDLSGVKKKELHKELKNQTSHFKQFSVGPKDPVVVKDFVESKGFLFLRGRLFYELTKTEIVQANKQIAVKDPVSNRIYGGQDARAFLKIPSAGEIKLAPSSDKRLKVFVLSTSNNRKLIPGTEVLYMI